MNFSVHFSVNGKNSVSETVKNTENRSDHHGVFMDVNNFRFHFRDQRARCGLTVGQHKSIN